jgi:hypothetical protein
MAMMYGETANLMNGSLTRQVERAIGNSFVEWLNQTTGNEFQFDRIGADPPDLIYRDDNKTLPIEIATSYYHKEDVIMRWKHARKDPTAPTEWSEPLEEPDKKLIADINRRIAKKCLGKHESGTVLVIECYPALTSITDFEGLKETIEIPSSIPFTAIYVAGDFPHSRDGPGGYSCWRIDDGKGLLQ